MHIIMILVGLAGLYGSYLHYHDHLLPKARGWHYKGIHVSQVNEAVAANLNYIKTGVGTGTSWSHT